jgi:E3 ubiquitin-protein ligase MARCH6
VAVAASQFVMSLVGVFAKWTQSIRDKEFLVELRLRNLDNPRLAEKFEAEEVQLAKIRREEVEEGEND